MHEEHSDSFYKSMRPALVFAQICGLIPIKGIFGPHHSNLIFTWRNPIHVYGSIVVLGAGFFLYAYSVDNLRDDLKLDTIGPTIFYATIILIFLLFLKIARRFPEICSIFADVEKNMSEYGYPKNLGIYLKIFILMSAFLAIVEHEIMNILGFQRAAEIASERNISIGNAFYDNTFHSISQIIPYNGFGLFIFYYVNMIQTLMWNFLDFFLICMSIQVSSKLSQINSKLTTINSANNNKLMWRKILEDYNRISVLTKKLDEYLSSLFSVSFCSNLYHLSLQLLRSLTMHGMTFFQKLYFYFSLAYLITRLLTVSICASKTNEESKNPLNFLFSLKEHCTESDRFLHQVATDDISFTGNKFFTINRKFVVTLIGTVVTYQIVLNQMHSLRDQGEEISPSSTEHPRTQC